MTKFFAAMNPDSDVMWQEALLAAGFIETRDPAQAHFFLHDVVHTAKLGQYLQEKPNFITPHTPQSSFVWDGIWGAGIPTSCNFVAGEAGKQVMESYGYPYRVEVVGFNRCPVRAFTPTPGNDLLIIPSHALEHGGYTYPNYIQWAVNMLRFILKNRDAFGKITLCWDETRFDPAVMDEMRRKGFIIIPTKPNQEPEPLKRMMERIEQVDRVMGCGTAGGVP